jgi:transposase-like protein
MGQKRSYKQYPKEFKEEAVALIRDQGYSVAEAAKSLRVATFTLPLEGAARAALDQSRAC